MSTSTGLLSQVILDVSSQGTYFGKKPVTDIVASIGTFVHTTRTQTFSVMQTRSKTRGPRREHAKTPKTMGDFIHVGEPLHDALFERTDAVETAWRQFSLDAKRALVLGGRDTKLRRDCRECTHHYWRMKDRELQTCVNCGEFKTFHTVCHYCVVVMAIAHN